MKRILNILILVIFIMSYGVLSEAQEIELLGAGATFPYPLYSKMFDVYYKEYGVKINYQAIGSGGGIRQLVNKTVDFGATDAFLKDKDLKTASAEIVHIPICLGAVVVTYNLPGKPAVKFTPKVLTDIFFRKIEKWNDSRLKEINPGVPLPNTKIITVHRSDGSGTTSIFTDYVSKVSLEWEKKIGSGKAVNWPSGLGAKGNPGVAGLIQQIPGSIGYVELVYALQNEMPVGIMQNKKGNYISPSLESVSLAANIDLPDDTRASITDTESPDGYPISGFTWIIVYKEQNYDSRSRIEANTVIDLLWWMIHQGQKYAEPLHYSPLSQGALKKAEVVLNSVTFDGKPLLK